MAFKLAAVSFDEGYKKGAEEMRERCIEIVKFEMLAGLIKDRTLERLRALSGEPGE